MVVQKWKLVFLSKQESSYGHGDSDIYSQQH